MTQLFGMMGVSGLQAAGGGGGSPGLTFQDSDFSGSTLTTFTFTGMTAAAATGEERMVCIGAVTQGDAAARTISSVTIDGQTASQVVRAASNFSGGDGAVTEIWRASGTSSTSMNVVVTWNGNCFSCYATLYNAIDVGTVIATATDLTQTPSDLNVNTAASGFALAATTAFSCGAATWTGLTEDFDGVPAFGDDLFSSASSTTVSATPRTISVARSANPGEVNMSAVAASFNPA